MQGAETTRIKPCNRLGGFNSFRLIHKEQQPKEQTNQYKHRQEHNNQLKQKDKSNELKKWLFFGVYDHQTKNKNSPKSTKKPEFIRALFTCKCLISKQLQAFGPAKY